MKLRRLEIERLPGIERRFQLASLGDGFHVVHGPNGIGKSSICRAVEALLWSDCGPQTRIELGADFELDGEIWRAERDGKQLRWRLNGSDTPAPDLPAANHRRYFFLRLRDLIAPEPDGETDMATEIRRQMSGGFNLAEIVSDHFAQLGTRSGPSARREFNDSETALRAAEASQAGLQLRLDQIGGLEERLEQAENDQRRVPHVERAAELAKRRARLAETERALSALPAGLERINGDEADRVARHQAKLEALRTRRSTHERGLEEAEREREESGLEDEIDPGQLNEWRSRADDLRHLEAELERAANEHRAASEKLRAARKSVGGGEPGEVELDLEDHAHMFDFLRAAQSLRSQTEALEKQINLLAKKEFSDEDRRRLERSNDAAQALRAWLRAPDPELAPKGPKYFAVWLTGAIVTAGLGAALAVQLHPYFALLAGIGLGAGVALLAGRGGRAKSSHREMARADFANTLVDPPEAWESASAETHLRDLDHRIGDLEARQMRARDREIERVKLQNDLTGLDGDQARIDSHRKKLIDDLKLDEIKPDAELVDLAHALHNLRQAGAEERALKGKRDDYQTRHDGLLADLAEILAIHGQDRPPEAAGALAGIAQLDARNTKLRDALGEARMIRNDMTRDDTEVSELEQAVGQIYAAGELEPGDLPGLRNLVELLPEYRELSAELTRLHNQNDLDREALEQADEAALAREDESALDQMHERLLNSAGEISDLTKQIADINAAVDAAKEGHGVRDLVEQRDAALARMEAHVSQALFEAAGKALVREVEEEHEKIQMPRVLERARRLFATFTRHSCEIEVPSGGETARLTARDLKTGAALGLDELSDGTRVQLLLAARIAFAEEVERGAKLPLFLDEALDQSDPERYRAIVGSLGRAAADQGRQVFYFTSDPSDLERIQQALGEEQCAKAQVIDLGRIRGQAQSVPGPAALQIEPMAPVPAPEGRSAEDYGALIGVPPLDPRLGPDGQHLYYLLWDDLNGLHELLGEGIEWVGQWRKFSGSDSAARMRSQSPGVSELDGRADLIEIFCALWSEGRGQPVDRDVIEESGALSDTWLEAAAAIAAEIEGDGKRLIEIMQARSDERLKGLRKKSIENLDQFLREGGYLDDRPVLDGDALRLRALSHPAAAKLPDGGAGRCLHRWSELSARVSSGEKT